jgi:hypothetical protein
MNCVPLPFQRGTVAEVVIMKCLMAADAAAKLGFLSTLDFGAFQMTAFDSNSFQVEALTATGLVADIEFQRAQLYHALRLLNQQNLSSNAAGRLVAIAQAATIIEALNELLALIVPQPTIAEKLASLQSIVANGLVMIRNAECLC